MEFSHPTFLFILSAAIAGVVFSLATVAAFVMKQKQEREFPMYRFSLLPFFGKCFLVVLVLAFLFSGLLEPRIVRSEVTSVPFRDAKVIFLLDVSRSMAATGDPSRPARLERAKFIIRDATKYLDNAEVSLWTFSQVTLPRVPFTLDYQYLFESLDRGVTIRYFPKPGSDITNSLIVARKAFAQVESDVKILVLLTEGEHRSPNTTSSVPKSFSDLGITLVVVGIGEDGERIPIFENGKFTGRFERMRDGREYVSSLREQRLQEIAEEAQGRYFHETETNLLNSFFGQEVKHADMLSESNELRKREYPLSPLFFLVSVASFLTVFLWKYK